MSWRPIIYAGPGGGYQVDGADFHSWSLMIVWGPWMLNLEFARRCP